MGMGTHPGLVIHNLRAQVSNGGRSTLGKLRQGLSMHDPRGTGVLTQREFSDALAAAGLFLTVQDISVLVRSLKSEQDPKKIDVQAFLAATRGDAEGGLSGGRLAMVEKAWKRIARGANSAPLQDLMAGFIVSKHPRVTTCEMTQEEVQERLVGDLQELGASGDTLGKETFFRYFEELSACVPEEKEFFFEQIAVGCFFTVDASFVPPERLDTLARFLCEKFRQISPREDLLRTVYLKFHYQDKGSTGGLHREEFSHLLTSVGMQLPDHERKAFFDYLAAPCGGGRIEFKSFSGLFRRISEMPPLPGNDGDDAQSKTGDDGDGVLGPTGKMERRASPPADEISGARAPVELIEKIKKLLDKGHPQGRQSVFLAFRRLDKEKQGSVSHTDFYAGLTQCNLRLGTAEVEKLLHYFDINRDGHVTYDHFLDMVRGPVAASRIDACEALWAKLGPKGSMEVPAIAADNYRAHLQPQVLAGKSTDQQKRGEFFSYIGEFLLLGSIPKHVVLNYFVDEGVMIPSDTDFQDYLESAFPEPGAGWLTSAP